MHYETELCWTMVFDIPKMVYFATFLLKAANPWELGFNTFKKCVRKTHVLGSVVRIFTRIWGLVLYGYKARTIGRLIMSLIREMVHG